MKTTFKHTGDLGDVIFSLPVIKALGGGVIYLGKSSITREPMSEEKIEFLRPLLESQPYIASVQRWDGEGVCYDFQEFRDRWDESPLGTNLVERHALPFKVSPAVGDVPWISVHPNTLNPVLIHRSSRYRGNCFPWNKVVQKYGDNLSFVGLKSEHEEFVKDFGKVDFCKVKDALEMARLISGARLWISNQSFPESLAEAMKKPKILEVPEALNSATSIYARPHSQYVFTPNIYLPNL